MQDKAPSPVKLRELQLEDGPQILALSERNLIGGLQPEAWRAQWEQYPLRADFAEVPAGWVLEGPEGDLCGYLGNIHQMYEIEGVRLKAAIATGWVVDEAQRGKSLQLVLSFYKQKGVDLYINGSANAAATKILTGFKIPRIPIPDYASPCFWAVRKRNFAQAVLKRKGVPAAALLSLVAGPALWIRDLVRGSGRGSKTVPVARLQSFDDRFDGLWQRLSDAVPRLRAVRTRAVLEWRFQKDLAAGRAILLLAGPAAEPTGYVVLQRRDGDELGMEMFDIADIQAVGDKPEVFESLLLASMEEAGREGADALKLITGTPAKRQAALALQPYSYELPFWQLYCKKAPHVSQALDRAEDWDFSLFETY